MTRCSAWSSPRRSTAPTRTSPRATSPSCAPPWSTPARWPASAATIGLGTYVKLGRGEDTTGGRDKASILSDTVEAVIGAVHLSGGLESSAAGRASALRPADRGRLGPRRRPRLEDLAPGALRRARPRRARVPHRRRGPRPHEDLHRAGAGRRAALRQRRRPLQEGGRAGRRGDGVRRARGELGVSDPASDRVIDAVVDAADD